MSYINKLKETVLPRLFDKVKQTSDAEEQDVEGNGCGPFPA